MFFSTTVRYKGIAVSIVAPGPTVTERYARNLGKSTHSLSNGEDLDDEEDDMQTLDRLGKVDDVARVCSWLASSDSTFVNGQVIRVDGGALQFAS